ncbi:MAG: alpha/beta hydrolase fold domain-containing protein [Akkermansiaceae bacterium]
MEYSVEYDVSYLDGSVNPSHRLDIYRPANAGGGKLPAVVYFHGGGWEAGNKSTAVARFKHFYDTGYILISVGYRLSREAIWPAMMDDVVAALDFVQSGIPDVDAGRVALWGSSAGGHLAALLAGGCRSEGMPDVRCLINYCAPVTLDVFVEHLSEEARVGSPLLKLFGGDHARTSEMARDATVTNWVSPGYPPTLSVHGDRDMVVPMDQSEILTGLILRAGSVAELFVAEGSEHRVDSDVVRGRVKEFLGRYL